MSDTARQRSDEFLRIADQFALGDLVTEQCHPLTESLSDVARQDLKAALKLLFRVDQDVLRKYRELVESGRLDRIARQALQALERGGRLFFTGCGSTGRLSILLDSIWRSFWQRNRSAADTATARVEDWEDRTVSVMAGGDYALIKAVEGFEDYATFGRRQLRDLGIGSKDVLFAITEGGETSFVIGTAWEGLERGATVYFVYNNPDDVLCRRVERSREVILDPRIHKLNLTTGPMAISGSTRMQATTIQLCVLGTILEMIVQRLVRGASDPIPDKVPHRFLCGLETLLDSLRTEPVLEGLASLVRAEADACRAGGRANYYADRFAIDVLADTTERSPTFSTPAFRKAGETTAAASWSFLFLPRHDTPQAWQWILKRPPRCLKWTGNDVRPLVPGERLPRILKVLDGIRTADLLKFEVGREGLDERPLRPGDYGLGIVSVTGSRQTLWDATAADWLAGLGQGAPARLLRFSDGTGPGPTTARLSVPPVTVPVPRTDFLLDALTRVAVKLVMNAVSTCLMVRLGRVLGNTMVYVVPSNLKLIDRATRYVARLAELPYAGANRRVFEAIEYIEPRLRAGRSAPPVVGLAVLKTRQGVAWSEAEKILEAASGDLGSRVKAPGGRAG